MVIRFECKVGLVGHSLRVTIPEQIAKALDIKAGEIVYVSTDDTRIILEKKKRQNHPELFEKYVVGLLLCLGQFPCELNQLKRTVY